VGRREVDDGAGGGTESFLPTYVYDAMKVTKRFEHMRVSFFSFLRPSVILSFLLLFFLSFPFLFFSLFFHLMFFPSYPMGHLMTIPIIQGGHQEDAEGSFGFYLDTLEKSFWPCWRLFLLFRLFLQTPVRRILRRGRTRNLCLLLAPPARWFLACLFPSLLTSSPISSFTDTAFTHTDKRYSVLYNPDIRW
jgi:hypothetical protein